MEYKCPNCGGAIAFDAESQQVKCPFCSTSFELETLKQYEQATIEQGKDDINWNIGASETWQSDEAGAMKMYTCNSCGGEILADETTAATSCPFCGGNVVLGGAFAGDLRPEAVIPFKLDKEAAKAALMRHYSGKKFLPDAFTQRNHVDEIKGIYVPFWLFDGDAEGYATYDATRVRSYTEGNYNCVETSHYLVTRKGKISFSGIPVDGDTKIDDTMMESIEPFNQEELSEFTTAYLAGYFADRYDVEVEKCIERANDRAKSTMSSVLSSSALGYTTLIPRDSAITTKNGKARYVLMPVWMLSTSFEGNRYMFAMNGQTGRLIGDLPIDKKKVMKYFSVYAAAFSAIGFVVTWLLRVF